MSDGLYKTDDPSAELGLVRSLRDAIGACDAARIPVLAIGSLAMTAYRRGAWPVGGGDIDVLVKRADARRAQAALVDAGFRREPSTEAWLLKAVRDHVLVDLIFVAGPGVDPDEEMFERAGASTVAGVPLNVISVEDYVVMQSLATKRAASGYWFDAIDLLPLVHDWTYLLRRAGANPARMLSLLGFATSEGNRSIPSWVFARLLASADIHVEPVTAGR